jgi:hypothetical protein
MMANGKATKVEYGNLPKQGRRSTAEGNNMFNRRILTLCTDSDTTLTSQPHIANQTATVQHSLNGENIPFLSQ